MIPRENIFKIGKFQKTHGLKGELNMISEIDGNYFKEGNPLIIDSDGIVVPFYTESIRPKGSTSFLIKLEGINDETEASQFINSDIYILKEDAEEWLDDEIIDSNSLIGFEVIELSNHNTIGVIKDIDDSTSNILFIVTNSENEEILFPASDHFIEEIDEETKKIFMNLPGGLLEVNRKD